MQSLLLKQKPLIIGLSGKAFSGKDTVADRLVSEYGFGKVSFAAPLKDLTAQLFGWPRSSLDDPVQKQAIDPFWGISPRSALQRLGTDCIRREFGDDFWIKTLERQHLPAHRLVISDVRFPNEAEAIKRWGGLLWRIQRPGPLIADSQHPSETALDEYDQWDAILANDGGLDRLHRQIDQLVSDWLPT